MQYKVLFSDICRKELVSASKPLRERALKMVEKITVDPLRFKRLHHYPRIFTVRIENLRLVYEVEKDMLIFLRFGNRDKVYKQLQKGYSK